MQPQWNRKQSIPTIGLKLCGLCCIWPHAYLTHCTQAMCQLNISSPQSSTFIRATVSQHWDNLWVLKGDWVTKHVSCLQKRYSSPLDPAMLSLCCTCLSNIIMVTSNREMKGTENVLCGNLGCALTGHFYLCLSFYFLSTWGIFSGSLAMCKFAKPVIQAWKFCVEQPVCF